MDKSLATVRTKFTIIAISLAVFCVALGGFGVYYLAESSLNQQINATKINQLASNDPAVTEYLASQEKYKAHFVTIAADIQRDNRQQLTRSLPAFLLIASVFSGLAGWILARKLLVPVKDSFVAQRRFMQDAAHELRNPLAALKTMVQQARRQPPRGVKLDSLFSSMDSQLNHLSAITTDLLLLERREYPGTQPTDIVALIKDILEEFHPQIMAKKLRIANDMPAVLVVKIDPQHFVYMAKNILENAIKFSDQDKPVIQIVLKPKADGWLLLVKDNGIGIATADIENITQRFYRGQNVTQIEGSGLGMAIVAKFVNIYNGSLKIKSIVGKGTTISVEM